MRSTEINLPVLKVSQLIALFFHTLLIIIRDNFLCTCIYSSCQVLSIAIKLKLREREARLQKLTESKA